MERAMLILAHLHWISTVCRCVADPRRRWGVEMSQALGGYYHGECWRYWEPLLMGTWEMVCIECMLRRKSRSILSGSFFLSNKYWRMEILGVIAVSSWSRWRTVRFFREQLRKLCRVWIRDWSWRSGLRFGSLTWRPRIIWRERRQETVPEILCHFLILCGGRDISSKGPSATVLLESKHVRD